MIAFSYNEPSIFFEYALDTMKLAKKQGIKTCYVTNGYGSSEQMKRLKGYLDAVNIDLKSFNDSFYRKICKARLQPVLETIRLCHKLGIWVEVTTLFIPGENDSDEEMEKISDFIASVDKNIPWHVTAFYPTYEMMDKQPTPPETLKRAYRIGKKKINHVYAGNIYENDMESTYCPKCKKKLIDRRGFYSVVVGLSGNKCRFCGEEIKGEF
jgi:pyruvate formate lyase activating enzyme